jgi:hypothetical protein
MADLMYWLVVIAVAIIHMMFGAFVYHLMFIDKITWFYPWDDKDDDVNHSIDTQKLTDIIMHIDEHTERDEEFFKEFTVEIFDDFGWDYFGMKELEHQVNNMDVDNRDIAEPKWNLPI